MFETAAVRQQFFTVRPSQAASLVHQPRQELSDLGTLVPPGKTIRRGGEAGSDLTPGLPELGHHWELGLNLQPPLEVGLVVRADQQPGEGTGQAALSPSQAGGVFFCREIFRILTSQFVRIAISTNE